MLRVQPPPRHPRQQWWPTVGQVLLVAFTWSAASVIVLATAAATRIGPVLYTINDRHGIHAFDILVGTMMFCLALLVTAGIVRPRRRWS